MEITSKKRQTIGKAVKSLRTEGFIPAVVFGNEIESTAIVLNRMEFAKLFAKAGETALIDLHIEKDKHKVLINEVQYDPISGKIIHAGFYKPNLKVKTEVKVPVKVIGEETNLLVKAGEGVILQLINEIGVRALPTDLPEAFVIDVSTLSEIGAGINIGQLSYDHDKVEIMDVDADELVIKLDSAIMAEEPEEVAAEEISEQEKIAQMEATAEKKAEDEEEGEDTKGKTENKGKGEGKKKE